MLIAKTPEQGPWCSPVNLLHIYRTGLLLARHTHTNYAISVYLFLV